MKRIIGLLLIIAMLIATSAFAEEEFTMHAGTRFGMTKDEIKKQEAYLSFEDVNKSGAFFPSDNYIMSGNTYVAGKNGTILYFFDEYDKMIACVYHFAGNTANPLTKLEYNDLISTLTEKYGTPVGDRSGYIEIGKYIDALDIRARMLESELSQYFYPTEEVFYQWLVPISDGAVDIMLMYEIQDFGKGKVFYGFISYTLRTNAEINTIMMQQNREQDSRNNDL